MDQKLTLKIRLQLVIASGLLAGLVLAAHAAERVGIKDGFPMQCDHHAQVDGRVRLYLSAGEDSYIEFKPEQVTSIEEVPDPPAQPVASLTPTASANGKLSAADLKEMLAKAGEDHNLDVDLLASLVKAESGGNARAVSRAGAKGLMQLMPGTAAGLGVRDSFKPGDNVRGGSTYLDELLTKYHENLALALAAYNAGPAAVDKYHGIPPYHETRVYVARVIHEFNQRVQAREAQARRAAALAVTSSTSASQ
jgi:hypothetical protein